MQKNNSRDKKNHPALEISIDKINNNPVQPDG